MPEKLLAILEKALDHRRLRIENERYRLRLEDMVRQKSATLMEALEQLKESHDFTLQALAGLLDVREHNTGKHSVRVRELSLVLGRAMGLPAKDIETLSYGALLHDIGKFAVRAADAGTLPPWNDAARKIYSDYHAVLTADFIEK